MPRRLTQMRQDAKEIFTAGIAAVEAGEAVRRHCRLQGDRLYLGTREIDLSRTDRLFVIGAGKATAAMAAMVEQILGPRISDGVIVVKYAHGADLQYTRVVEAGHPVPDENGLAGAEAMLALAGEAGPEDVLLCLISGGGSALLPLPAPGLTLQDKQEMINTLLACGASIHEINTLRKHTSAIKGGRLAQSARPARLASLILSDVVGDDLDVIASGPTVPDSSSFEDCMAIIERYDIRTRLPEAVLSHIIDGCDKRVTETPKPGNAAFERVDNLIVGSNIDAIRAAAAKAETLGYHTLILSSMIEGETRHVAMVHAGIAREILQSGHPLSPPACVLSGGETTVTLSGDGLGGRNQEFALAAVMPIANRGPVVLLSGGTDGTDGPTDAAGAVVDSATAGRARDAGLDPAAYLKANDGYHFFEALDDLIRTGPTRTNVMDLRVMLVA